MLLIVLMAIVALDSVQTLVAQEREPICTSSLVDNYTRFSNPSTCVLDGQKCRVFRSGFKVQVMVLFCRLELVPPKNGLMHMTQPSTYAYMHKHI